ncbi:unnamed protein product [Ambrosiozyma monospora]|uniref:Endoplasmic reticulum lectin n=1 Tax=Ambrosiozyma monospora TaxID=43982 RepID=A0A9W7DKR8_AMBMO|nr:unnamed protein product [Ambrosiozyma monospora]
MQWLTISPSNILIPILLIPASLAKNTVSSYVTLDDQTPQYHIKFNNEWANDELLQETKSLYIINNDLFDYACNVTTPGSWLNELDSYMTKTIGSLDDNDNLTNAPELEKRNAIDTVKGFSVRREYSPNPSDHCIDLIEGYWAYRYCYQHELLQFHYDQEKLMKTGILTPHPEVPVYRLASMNGASAYDKASEFELVKTKDGSKYLTQLVGNGSICDLTGQPRLTTIHYKCDPEFHKPKMDSIEELQTCQYKVAITSAEFCGNPSFRPMRDMTTANVSCYPIREEDDSGSGSQLPDEFKDEKPMVLEPLDLNAISLLPIGYGIFIGTYKNNELPPEQLTRNPFKKEGDEVPPTNFLLSHKQVHYEVVVDDNLDLDKEIEQRRQVLDDISKAFSMFINSNRMATPPQIKKKRAVNFSDRFVYTTSLFGLSLEFAGQVVISSEGDGSITAYFGELDYAYGNYVSFNGEVFA